MKKLLIIALFLIGCGNPGTVSQLYQPSINCSVTTVNNMTEITCPDGTHSTIDQENFVQLCPGTPSYPNTFIEYAICYQGNLYAVYSIPGAFLTYIPPGNYTSNGIGSNCNLIVSQNCTITNY